MISEANKAREGCFMKKGGKFLIIAIWVSIIFLLFKLGLLTGSLYNLNQYINNFGSYKELIFVLLATLRVVAFIPSAVFMLLSGLIFNPFEGIGLNFISIVISETIVFAVSKILISSNIQKFLVKKNPRLYKLLLKNNKKILAIGIICPMAPSDVACFLASSTGLSYKRFMIIVVLSNMPMMILYSLLGISAASSAAKVIIIGAIIAIISLYSLYLWKKAEKTDNELYLYKYRKII